MTEQKFNEGIRVRPDSENRDQNPVGSQDSSKDNKTCFESGQIIKRQHQIFHPEK